MFIRAELSYKHIGRKNALLYFQITGMKDHYNDYDILLANYFSGDITDTGKEAIEQWINASDENRVVFNNAEKAWQSLELLQEMRKYNAVSALADVNVKIEQESAAQRGVLYYWQRIAAVLLLPLLIVGGISFMTGKHISDSTVLWQTITTPPGVKSQAQLPDGTKVWLNSGSSLRYPSSFSNNSREVELKGEAFFDVAKDVKRPFFVDLGKIGIEVVGTEFNVINYEWEKQTEVVLASGKVKLFGKQENEKQLIAEMEPGQQAIYSKAEEELSLKYVDTEKYISWINGRLIFKDDPMDEVIRKLDRWFNVEFELEDPEVAQYIYTATFQYETIEQILNLIKRTSPVEYVIIPGNHLIDGSFEKQKIILKKR